MHCEICRAKLRCCSQQVGKTSWGKYFRWLKYKKYKINCIVFLDIRKAFDLINHNILLSKMRSNFGISGNELLWFESYLTNREQQCVVNGILSSVGKLKCGVPQGSILGPLLFLLYINDLPQCLQKTTPGLYADDTEIYASSHNVNDLRHHTM